MQKIVNGELIDLTPEEVAERETLAAFANAAISLTTLKTNAKIELESTDLVAIRCFKAGIEFPFAWQDRANVLREIIRGNNPGPIPIKPAYPEGT